AQTIKLADADYAQGKPFLLQLMTTSNHRPYTYPDGRIDILSGEGREGAVKYTDYAIGEFLRQAKQKPWFADTVFVFVADHTAGSAGKEDLPVSNYHIPMFIYAPQQFAPREINTLTSQIDIAPTLLGLLNQSYQSTFFGRDVLRPEADQRGRAVLGNYQHLGLFDGEDLAILSPRKMMRRHDDALGVSHERRADKNSELVQRDIAYYQGASHAIAHGLLQWQDPIALKKSTFAHLQGQY
ncbi:MAG: LTA synthase family protein, partial [Gammaproteobacteria bacterium]|nr:LTA synthase family protein [Gammaproteobacteria bacterium]